MIKKFKKSIHRELYSYVFWGITTTFVNIFVYIIFCNITKYWIANIMAIISGKIYAYYVNKIFVFRSKCPTFKDWLRELSSYILTRGFSGLLDFGGVIILVEWLSLNKTLAKYILTILVIALNYILGKKIVFVNKNKYKGDWL